MVNSMNLRQLPIDKTETGYKLLVSGIATDSEYVCIDQIGPLVNLTYRGITRPPFGWGSEEVRIYDGKVLFERSVSGSFFNRDALLRECATTALFIEEGIQLDPNTSNRPNSPTDSSNKAYGIRRKMLDVIFSLDEDGQTDIVDKIMCL